LGIVKLEPYDQTEEDKKAYSWCINHGIKIGMLAVAPGFDNADWKIRVVENGKEKISPRDYNKREILPKLFELYRFYYDKNVQQ
jgi:hypothetical protein